MSIRIILAAAVALAALATGPGDAAAQKTKAKSGCSVKQFPLTVGNSWTYVPGTPPAEPTEAMARINPVQPKQLVITVKDVVVDAGVTVVKLEEDIDGRKLETSISCAAGTWEVSPESFFFAGEPGGQFSVELDKVERKLKDVESGPSKPWASTWREDMTALWKRVPEKGIEADLGHGKLEIERRFTLSRTEKIKLPARGEVVAAQLRIEVTGRVWIDGVERPSEMPANWINTVWVADGLGVVQVLNSYSQMYQLSDATIVK